MGASFGGVLPADGETQRPISIPAALGGGGQLDIERFWVNGCCKGNEFAGVLKFVYPPGDT